MNKPSLFLLLSLAIAAGFALNHYATGQSSRSANSPGAVAMQRLDGLVSDLTDRGDTNTLSQVTRMLAAKDALTQTKDASTAVALLHRLREGRTNEVIEVLEITLDGALTGLAYSPEEIGEAQMKTLQMARDYRSKYPRKQTEGVTKAFELLDKP